MKDLPIAISLNFDSLNEAFGFPKGYRDPSFFEGFDRLADIASRYQIPLSIYIIGRDLENPENAARVRAWSEAGHEIGNHTWSHHFNLASLSKQEQIDEVRRCHDKISHCIGQEPKGFIAPAWSSSKQVIEELIRLGYIYDTSPFPSILLYPMVAKIFLNHLNQPLKAVRLLFRRDWLDPLIRPTTPYFINHKMKPSKQVLDNGLLVMPLPTQSRFHPCIWHTLGFISNWRRIEQALETLIDTHPGLYYLIHPADFLAQEDVDTTYTHSLARMATPLQEKLARLETIFSLLAASQRPKTTMRKLADRLIQRGVVE
ncbi:polysaccharide deacetylase family protein [Magnetococcales bacterium HHB-1]